MKYILQIKNYGDLVIALNYLRYISNRCYGLICSSHLRPLVEQLNTNVNIIYIDNKICSNSVSFYNIKKSNIIDVIESFLYIKKEIKKLLQVGDIIIFDKIGPREKLIAGSIKSDQIFKYGKNIYIDYENFFGKKKKFDESLRYKKNLNTVNIFPDASRREKILPLDSLIKINLALKGIGVNFNICFFQTNKYNYNFENSITYNTFGDLVEIIKSSSLVVSSDSLTGHLAEFYGIKNFILFNKLNSYWLPKKAYENKSYSLFSEVENCIKWVKDIF